MSTATVYPLTIYFDASCPLCASEMSALKQHDRDGRLVLVDCSEAGFTDAPLDAAGLTQRDVMQIIHARDATGQWLRGVAVFEAAYRGVGLNVLAFLWGCRLWRPLLDRIYPWIARHRQALSRLGLPAAVRAGIGAPGSGGKCELEACSNVRKPGTTSSP